MNCYNASRTDKNVSKRRRYTIDEADIDGYLNNKKEALYKKMIWELLNKDYTTHKHQPNNNQKPPKPNNTNKRAASQLDMEMDKEEEKKKKKKLGSRINFDVLEKETADQEEKEAEGPGKLEVDETVTAGGDDDYRDGFEEGNESNDEDAGYGDYLYGEGDEDDGCDDNGEEYWIQ